MAIYSHQQDGKLIRRIIGLAIVITIIAVLIAAPKFDWWVITIPIIMSIICIKAASLFASLSAEVDQQNLHWWFGKGFWRKSIPLADIASAMPVTNKWWWGWGIRYYGKGWLYCVSGLDAVEIILKSGKHIRIGTDDPQGLSKALSKTLPPTG